MIEGFFFARVRCTHSFWRGLAQCRSPHTLASSFTVCHGPTPQRCGGRRTNAHFCSPCQFLVVRQLLEEFFFAAVARASPVA